MLKKNKTEQTKKSQIVKHTIEFFTKNPSRSYNYKQIASIMNVKDTAGKQMLNSLLAKLVRQKILVAINEGKYQIHSKTVKSSTSSQYAVGIVDMKASRKAYILCDNTTEDIFVAPDNTNRALHGDKVKVFLFPKRKDRQAEGQIIEIIKRAKSKFVGTIQISKNFAFLIPDNNAMPIDIFIPLNELNGAKNGQKVLAQISEWHEKAKNPIGKVLEVLGQPGDNNVEMNSILAEFDFPLSFSKEVTKEAKNIEYKISQKEISSRKDFRNTITFTIDPEDANDFDDAISIKKLQNNHWEIGVHIADVSYYVKTNSKIDNEAFIRGTSVYLVDRVVPMLPEQLSNNICSLKAYEDKLCFSIVFEIDDNANIFNQWVGKTIINSNKRFNYEEVQNIIELSKGEFAYEISVLNKIAHKLRNKRFKDGSFAFETNEVKFKLDEKGKPVDVYMKKHLDSNKLIEDFMLLANRKIAEMIGEKKDKKQIKSFVYRIHNAPIPEKLNTFSEFVKKLGYIMNTDSRKNIALSFNKLHKDIAGKGEEHMISNIAIRTMAKAVYSTINIGHYGLAFDYYTHFTSPIRRYPDLMVHRILEMYMNGNASINAIEYEEKCKHTSDMEKKAAEAERASIKYKQVEFLQDKVGQTFNGLISGVSKWGIYVEIDGNKCEGMISLRDLEDDFYYLDEDNYCVIGQKNNTKFNLGDNVKIRVKRANMIKKQLDFEFV